MAGLLVGTPATAVGAEPQAVNYTVQAVNNSLVVFISNAAGDSTMSVDSTGLTFNQVSAVVTGNGLNLQCWVATTVATGAITVNCHSQFGDTIHCHVAEFSGIQTASQIDTNNTGTAASGTSLDSAAFTLTVTGTVIGCGFHLSGTPDVGSGFTNVSSTTFSRMEYKPAQSGSQTANETDAGSNAWLIQGFGLKEATAALNIPAIGGQSSVVRRKYEVIGY